MSNYWQFCMHILFSHKCYKFCSSHPSQFQNSHNGNILVLKPRTHSLFLNNLRYLDNMQAHNMMFPHMRDFQLLNVSSRNYNSMNYHFSLPLKEASSRVPYLDIKKGTKTLKSLTISSFKKKEAYLHKQNEIQNSLHNFLHSHITASC